MRIGSFNHQRRSRLFTIVPWIIGIGIALTFTIVIAQFAVIGWAGYHVLTDPEGTANIVGTIAGEAIRPVAEAIKGE